MVQAIVLERPVFVREQSDGLYRVITYLTFKVLEEVLLAVVSSVAFSLMVYYLVKLQGSFFPVWIVFLVTQLVGVGESLTMPCDWMDGLCHFCSVACMYWQVTDCTVFVVCCLSVVYEFDSSSSHLHQPSFMTPG